MLIPITMVLFCTKIILKDNGPLFYSQERIGKDGKIFKLYKYRSMVVGADEKLKEYLAQNEEARNEYKKNKKLKNDPRITAVGKFIRKTSIDEFPQFINVLKGEMSLVGPRPYLPREKEDMGGYYHYIVKCKPGLTGYWQVNGRSHVTFEDRLEMDYKYYNEKSLKNDVKLLKKTVEKVLKKEGAI
jgi:undecaprenyl-phosphate galactose phosphotransferase